jgi:hypothetical protein
VLRGTGDPDELVGGRATLADFDTEAVTLAGVELLQVVAEIAVAGREASLPSGLHPTNPPTCVLQVWRCPDSPWGPFAQAQVRVGCRSGLRPRGFVQGCVVDAPEAAAALRARWGFPARPGAVELRRGYDGVTASASLAPAGTGGTVVPPTAVLAISGLDPEPLGVDDVAYTATVTLADTPRGLRLVQVDADVVAARAERLRPRLDAFATADWVHGSVAPVHLVSASIAVADVTLQRLRYVSRPDELAFTGTEPV